MVENNTSHMDDENNLQIKGPPWGVSRGSVIVGVRNSQKGDCVCEKVRGESG